MQLYDCQVTDKVSHMICTSIHPNGHTSRLLRGWDCVKCPTSVVDFICSLRPRNQLEKGNLQILPNAGFKTVYVRATVHLDINIYNWSNWKKNCEKSSRCGLSVTNKILNETRLFKWKHHVCTIYVKMVGISMSSVMQFLALFFWIPVEFLVSSCTHGTLLWEYRHSWQRHNAGRECSLPCP